MNWITNFVRPRIKSMLGVKETTPDNLWTKCPSCGEMLFQRDLEAAQYVCSHCDFHMKANARQRFQWLFDDAQFEELPFIPVAADPLKFRDEKRYPDRIKEARTKTGQQDAVIAAKGTIAGVPAMVVAQNFAFMGGSLGMAAGEAFIAGAERAVNDHVPLVLVVASGGARMQEGILSLMQMPRATVAVQMLRDARLPYVVVLTDPTTGGVVASYAMLGDIQIAEPGAVIGFSGRRVIENTIREKLPDSFQKAEYLLEHGMVDMVVHRHKLKETIARLISMLMKTPVSAAIAKAVAEPEGGALVPDGVEADAVPPPPESEPQAAQ
ncbi:Acetyl-coenzyme A carboxylase carboxyl transferase subunit beta [Alphaproteobacteria bacterium SO-S41]|nr:Acetyl-coenzyme A carboxylase carboxyl transferase subunit beta [Alphaproteobacteria bacterium SO-S41]